NFGTQLGVVTLQANNNRHFHANFFNGTDHTFSDHVTTHDTTEDIDEYGFNSGIGQDDFERFNNALFGCAAANVQEVGRLATVQFNDVHGTHCQTGAVYHTTDITTECNIVQFPGSSVCFTRIFLSRILHFFQFRVTVQRIAVDNQLGIEAVQITFRSDNQRVNFQQRQIFVFKELGQAEENVNELIDLFAFQTQLECQFTRLERLSTHQRIDGCFQNFFRGFVSDFLDLNTTFSGRHENDTTAGAINNCTQVKFFGDVGTGFHQNTTNWLAFFISLVSNQVI